MISDFFKLSTLDLGSSFYPAVGWHRARKTDTVMGWHKLTELIVLVLNNNVFMPDMNILWCAFSMAQPAIGIVIEFSYIESVSQP